MSDRFFSERPIDTDHANLDGSEAHHLIHVMRAAVGAEVTLFDGSGAEFPSRIFKIGRSTVEFEVLSRRETDRELAGEISLAAPLPKGDRQRWLIEKAVELGAARFIPLVTERSVAQPTGNAMNRLNRYIIEASKQCGRNRLMSVEPATKFDDLVRNNNVTQIIVADPTGSIMKRGSRDDARILVVGPEGGLSDDELLLAREQGCRLVCLGPRILRTETAGIALLASAIYA